MQQQVLDINIKSDYNKALYNSFVQNTTTWYLGYMFIGSFDIIINDIQYFLRKS